METEETLVRKFNTLSEDEHLDKDIPDFVAKNLNQKFAVREYQKEALARFVYYLNRYKKRTNPVHLLFHMGYR